MRTYAAMTAASGTLVRDRIAPDQRGGPTALITQHTRPSIAAGAPRSRPQTPARRTGLSHSEGTGGSTQSSRPHPAPRLAAGSGVITGFPTIWAQKIKDVKLLQVGGSYSSIIDIARQAIDSRRYRIIIR